MHTGIKLKTSSDIDRIKRAGSVLAEIFSLLYSMDLVGFTTWEIDTFIDEQIVRRGGRPVFKTLPNYRFASCISINSEAVHGIPSKKRLITTGDLVKIDSGVSVQGYCADSCVTLGAGSISQEDQHLIDTTKAALIQGIYALVPGNCLEDAGRIIEQEASKRGCSVVRECTGHGTGFALHEPPTVFHYDTATRSQIIQEGLVLTLEPVLTRGSGSVQYHANDWTVLTVDGMASAQFEHTIAVTEKGPIILTKS